MVIIWCGPAWSLSRMERTLRSSAGHHPSSAHLGAGALLELYRFKGNQAQSVPAVERAQGPDHCVVLIPLTLFRFAGRTHLQQLNNRRHICCYSN